MKDEFNAHLERHGSIFHVSIKPDRTRQESRCFFRIIIRGRKDYSYKYGIRIKRGIKKMLTINEYLGKFQSRPFLGQVYKQGSHPIRQWRIVVPVIEIEVDILLSSSSRTFSSVLHGAINLD